MCMNPWNTTSHMEEMQRFLILYYSFQYLGQAKSSPHSDSEEKSHSSMAARTGGTGKCESEIKTE